MFYEEKVINGRLKFRSTPNGEWQEFTYEQLTVRVVEAEAKADRLLDDIREMGERDD